MARPTASRNPYARKSEAKPAPEHAHRQRPADAEPWTSGDLLLAILGASLDPARANRPLFKSAPAPKRRKRPHASV